MGERRNSFPELAKYSGEYWRVFGESRRHAATIRTGTIVSEYPPGTETRSKKHRRRSVKTKKQYAAALSNLPDKRDALRRDELVKVIIKSERTYEEVLAFPGVGDAEEKT